jgi:hypothetical protein
MHRKEGSRGRAKGFSDRRAEQLRIWWGGLKWVVESTRKLPLEHHFWFDNVLNEFHCQQYAGKSKGNGQHR